MLLVLICVLPACEDDKVEVRFYSESEYQTLSASLSLPEVLDNYNPRFEGDHRTNAMATLGRVLFYDENLSRDNSVSCASCHKQELAFADNVSLSKGIEGRSTSRNSIALGVFRSFDEYSSDPGTTLFWDGRVDNLHSQMIETIGNPNEMGMQLNDIAEKIKGLDYYKILASKATQTEEINEQTILEALAAFMNSISTSTSKFDVASRNVFDPTAEWPLLSTVENQGKNIFIQNCQNCHSEGLENTSVIFNEKLRTANNGLDIVYTDKGAGEFDHSPEALGIFKIPGLRNIQLSAPYMHDGRFATLEDVIDFYSENIQDHPNLHPLLSANGAPRKFNFSEDEKLALVQFLKTLTDINMVNEPKWSNPFL